MSNYQSNAQWPEGTLSGYNDDVSTDKHFDYNSASHVCRALENEGFGGEGKIFPVKTWVSEIKSN